MDFQIIFLKVIVGIASGIMLVLLFFLQMSYVAELDAEKECQELGFDTGSFVTAGKINCWDYEKYYISTENGWEQKVIVAPIDTEEN